MCTLGFSRTIFNKFGDVLGRILWIEINKQNTEELATSQKLDTESTVGQHVNGKNRG